MCIGVHVTVQQNDVRGPSRNVNESDNCPGAYLCKSQIPVARGDMTASNRGRFQISEVLSRSFSSACLSDLFDARKHREDDNDASDIIYDREAHITCLQEGDSGSGSISHHRCVITESPSGENSRSPLNNPWNASNDRWINLAICSEYEANSAWVVVKVDGVISNTRPQCLQLRVICCQTVV